MIIDFEQFGSWIPLIVFFATVLGLFWKMADGLNSSIKDLHHEIKTLNTSIRTGQVEHEKTKRRLEETNARLERHETRISILEEYRRGNYHGVTHNEDSSQGGLNNG